MQASKLEMPGWGDASARVGHPKQAWGARPEDAAACFVFILLISITGRVVLCRVFSPAGNRAGHGWPAGCQPRVAGLWAEGSL